MRMKPKDMKRYAELDTKGKLTAEEKKEHERLYEIFTADRKSRDQGGVAYRDVDGKIYSPSTERRSRRIIKAVAWRLKKGKRLNQQQADKINKLCNQLNIPFATGLIQALCVLNPKELTLFSDIVRCNGNLHNIAKMRTKRNEAKNNPPSVKRDIASLIEAYPYADYVIKGIQKRESARMTTIKIIPTDLTVFKKWDEFKSDVLDIVSDRKLADMERVSGIIQSVKDIFKM